MRSRLAWISVAGVALLALEASGCSQRAMAQNSGLSQTGAKYCDPFKTAAATSGQAAVADPAAAFEDCVHRWGYTLAPARDPADVVAQATVDACGPVLTAWNQQTLGQGTPETEQHGRATINPELAERMRAAESRALFYVVQARASGCAPPPANTLLTAQATTQPAG